MIEKKCFQEIDLKSPRDKLSLCVPGAHVKHAFPFLSHVLILNSTEVFLIMSIVYQPTLSEWTKNGFYNGEV